MGHKTSKGGSELENLMKVQQKIVPEAVELLERRYSMMRTIFNCQPVGRRLLAQKLGLGERLVRAEIDFLKAQGLVTVSGPGVILTGDGEGLLSILKEFVSEIKGLDEIEEILKRELHYKRVIIVPGDLDADPNVKSELGRAAAKYVAGILRKGDIIALTGGSTIQDFVESFPKKDEYGDLTIVPARGSMGKDIEIQSNTLVASLAEKLGASYRLLNVPDNISERTLEAVLEESEIKEVVATIKKANVIILGIGRADVMAKRRGLGPEDINNLITLGAQGEAFGTYFARNGKIVKKAAAVGLSIDDSLKVKELVAVSGGTSKGDAIAAVRFTGENAVLVTDEGAARKIIKALKSKNKDLT